MIVIERDGKTVVITGWRAWLLGAVAVVVTTAVLAALTFLVLGIAVSMIAFLLIVMPAVAIVALVAWFFQPRSSRPPLSESDQAALEGAAGHREQPRRTGLHLFARCGISATGGCERDAATKYFRG
jgi:hypothetical protein